MAFSIGNLIAKIKVDTSDIAVAQREVASSTKKMSSSIDGAAKSSEKLSDSLKDSANSAKTAGVGFSAVGAGVKSLAAGFALYLGLDAAKKIATHADNLALLDSRIKNATSSTAEFNATQKELLAISNSSGTALGSVVSLFEGVKMAGADIGATNGQVLELVDLLNKLGVIGGSTGEQMSNSMMQFSQAMGGGIVRAEEWNSVLENTPAIARAIASGLGKSVGEMRKMVNDGKVLSEDVFNSLLKQSDDIQTKFESMPSTVGIATNQALNEFGAFIKDINDEFVITGFIADRIKALAEEIAFIRQGFNDREYLSALNEYNDLTVEIEQNQNKLNEALGESGASIQNINRINALTEKQLALEDRLLEVKKKISDHNAASGEDGEKPDEQGGKPKKIPKSQTDEYLKRREAEGTAALNARARQLEVAQKAEEDAAKKLIEDEEALAQRRAEIGQAALDNRAKQFQQEIDQYNAYYAALDAKAAEYYARQEEVEQQDLEKRASVGQAALDTRARQFEAEKEAQAQALQTQLTAYSAFSNQMLQLMSDAGNEQSSLYKAMLLFSQALAVAQIIIETNVAAAKTRAALAPFGEGQAQMTLATGYASAGLVAGMAVGKTIGGGRRHGGNVYADTMHKVAEGGPEILTQGKDKYLISDKQGKVTPISEHTATPQMPTVNVTLIEDSSRAGTVQQTQSQAGIDIKVFTSLIRSTVASDIASGGNQISRSLNAVGLKRQGITNG